MLGNYSYDLFEKDEDELIPFLKSKKWDGLNVTIPYKKSVIPYIDHISDVALKAGSINTITRGLDGKTYGNNTDVYGFIETIKVSGIDVIGKKVLVLGTGGAATAVKVALGSFDTDPIMISRQGTDTYENIDKHADAQIIINTTPLGMYPHNGESAIDLRSFPKCEGVFDLIYNPARTNLLLQAESRGIPHINGLYMLVAQAKASSELFTGFHIPDERIRSILDKIDMSQKNIVLIGMPGCGKSTIARKIGIMTGRKVIDTDDEITIRTGMTPSDIITQQNEDALRRMETDVIRDIGKLSGTIISTGGGAVTRRENYEPLHQNAVIVWIQRDLTELSSYNRPLSQKYGLETLYKERAPLYERFADIIIKSGHGETLEAETILSAIKNQEHDK